LVPLIHKVRKCAGEASINSIVDGLEGSNVRGWVCPLPRWIQLFVAIDDSRQVQGQDVAKVVGGSSTENVLW
jgi:hypothetical protein